MTKTSASRSLFDLLSIGALIVILMCALPAQAQFDSAQISGVVQDSAGAVIPGVSVTAINEGTREERQTFSNEQGVYVFPGLQIATYTISAELAGFKRFVKTGNELSASVNVRLNVVLEVGEISQTIEVQATTNEVVAESAVIGRSVGAREIAEIPLAGRNVALVGQFRAGVMGGAISTNPNSGAATFSNGGFSINGARGDEYVTTVDGGLSLRIRSQTGFTMGAQNIDTVQEVQVLTSNYQAELGRASGGLVRVVTKSGTREFHGVLFETHQNSALNANTWARNASPDPRLAEKPEAQRYNSFGFALGGPIFIPGKFNADRSKVFFYIGEEWGRLPARRSQRRRCPAWPCATAILANCSMPRGILRHFRLGSDTCTGIQLLLQLSELERRACCGALGSWRIWHFRHHANPIRRALPGDDH